MRQRFKDAGITLEQIVDGTTGCEIWFFINVAVRKCFMSTEEQSDGSVDVIISSFEDWLTIPEGFYQLTGREVKGANACDFTSFLVSGETYVLLDAITANACDFTSFLVSGETYVLLDAITAQEVIEQGLFERVEIDEQDVNKYAIGSAGVIANSTKKLVNDQQPFPMSRAALVSKYKAQWPSIERDMQDASKNGLSVAKAGTRKWTEHLALQWAKSNNKFKDRVDAPNSPQMMMANLPSRVINKLT